ncbi:MAG: PD-(D/E)XK nuclease family protein [Bacteroidia bacterium]|nr:PD-(D/E)XK nuclease family protein [Bacteroidia bacterium]MDW8088990.1 PD-(D/E)XK nuclease family protein [Bacteroidia bacterium]
MNTLLPAPLQEAIEVQPKKTYLLPDPFLAQALSAYWPNIEFYDLYTWASIQKGVALPDPIDLYRAFKAAFGSKLSELADFPLIWEEAQKLGKDWEELLKGVPRFSLASTFWKQLAHEMRLILRYAPDTQEVRKWESFIFLPLAYDQKKTNFWENFTKDIEKYSDFLSRNKRAFAEALLHQLLEEEAAWEGVVFLHLYDTYSLFTELLKLAQARRAAAWGWDLRPLKQALPEIWGDRIAPTDLAVPLPHEPKPTFLYRVFSPVEAVERAAQAIQEAAKANPTAIIGVLCEPMYEPLLRQFLGEALPLSPAPKSLWEGSTIGAQLSPFVTAGLQGQCRTWPPFKPADPTPFEQYAEALYKLFTTEAAPNRPENWRLLLHLLQQARSPKADFSPSVRIFIGRLAQLAGGAYDKLFLVLPSAEPLGQWERPTFWLAKVRQQFASRLQHQRIAWQLLSLLLWASKEIYLWREASPASQTPIEELLLHAEEIGIKNLFKVEVRDLARPAAERKQVVFPPAAPLTLMPNGQEIASLKNQSSFSITESLKLMSCPRRYYWSRVLPAQTYAEPARLGQLLHLLLEKAFQRPKRSSEASATSLPGASYAFTLRRLGYGLSPRRLFYRIGHLEVAIRSDKLRWRRLLPRQSRLLLRPLLAGVGQPILHTFYALLKPIPAMEQDSFTEALRWHHLKNEKEDFYLLPELWLVSHPFQATARLDLLVRSKQPSSRWILLDFKSTLPDPIKNKRDEDLKDFIDEALEGLEVWREGGFLELSLWQEAWAQLLLYLALLRQRRIEVEEAVIVSLWWRPSRKKAKPNPPYIKVVRAELPPDWEQRILAFWKGLVEGLQAKLPQGMEAFPMRPRGTLCTYCDYALLCDRLSS